MDIRDVNLKAIFDQAAVGIAQIGLDGTWMFANNRYHQMLGYSEAELRTKTLQDITHLEDYAESVAGRNQLLDGVISSHSMEKRYIRKDGTVFWARIHRSLVRDHDNQPKYIVAVVEDITERKRTEETLRVSQERFDLAQEASRTGTWNWDAPTGEIHCSSGYGPLYGLPSSDPAPSFEEWLGRIHPEDRARMRKELDRHLESADRFVTEFRVVWPDGTIHWLYGQGQVFRDSQGNPIRMIGVNMEISERKAAEAALRESEERFRLAMNDVDCGVYTLDLKGLVTYVNPAAERMFGWTNEELLGKKMHDVTHYKHPDGTPFPAHECPGLQILENGIEVHEREDMFVRRDGSFLPVVFSASPLRSDGKTVGIVVGFRDDTPRREAERAVRESEQRFRKGADSAPVMIWASGLDKRCTYFNKPWLDFTGRTMEQERGNGWANGVHPEDLDRCFAIYSSSFDARSPFQMEYRLRRADGEYRWVLDHGAPRYSDGKFAGFIDSCIDISEQTLMAERLRAQAAQLQDAQRLAKIGSWERRTAPESIEWSDEMFRIFGLPSPPKTLEALLNYVHPKDRESVLEAGARARSSTSPVTLSYRIIRPGGEMRFVSSVLEVIREDQGAAVRTVGAIQDITEQVEAAERLRESEQRLRSAERLAHVGNWQRNLKTNFTTWSDELFRILGKPRNHIPSFEEFLQVVVPQDRERVARWIGECHATKSGGSMEFQIALPHGEVRTISSTLEVLLDEEGSPAHLFGAAQDITDLRHAQQQSFERQKLESVGTLASGVAHDFNNLLGAVLAQAELAQAELAAGSDPQEELERIREAAIRGSEIVRELMIYAGKERDLSGRVDVSRIVREMIELLKVSVSKHAVLEMDLGKGLPAVQANAAQLRQVVMNLITNASEAIGNRDGVIRVTTKCVTAGRDPVGTISEGLAGGDFVQLEVSDTGRGIPPETRAKIFDPFFSTKSAGRGLGLAVVQGIVRALRGEIHLESELDRGTTFQILLPCSETAVQTPPNGTAREESALPSQAATILVVEDEDSLRHAVVKTLRGRGFSVIESGDGFAALEAIRTRKNPIDLLFLDLNLPGAPSKEVFEEAKRVRPEMKLIVTSAYGEDMAAASLQSKVAHFLRKPYQLRELVDLIRQVLQ